jgi:hypothetical protein
MRKILLLSASLLALTCTVAAELRATKAELHRLQLINEFANTEHRDLSAALHYLNSVRADRRCDGYIGGG